MLKITSLRGREVLDSRGRPTVAVECRLEDRPAVQVSVPSGASTGAAECRELRDGDPRRFGGLGCLQAVENVNRRIASAVCGRGWESQAQLDRALLDLDGTADKSGLGGNAMLAVSLAFARARAAAGDLPLYQYFARMIDRDVRSLPRMTINLFSGGLHAGSQVAIQDLLVVPARAATIAEGLADTYAVYQAAVALTSQRYGVRPLRADEGGLAPPFPDSHQMLADAVEAIQRAALEPGSDICLAIDVAASHFFTESQAYRLDGNLLTSEQLVERLADWSARYPVVSVEDGLAENDWQHWPHLCQALAPRQLVVGDDLLCTQPKRIRRAVEHQCATGLLLKVNQVGTLTEAAEACCLAREAGWQVTVSARSGETEDNWLADLAVAWGDQIKVGSITQSERLAKYNRLLGIEAETHLPVHRWPSVE